MSGFEFQFSVLKSVVAERNSLCGILEKAARAVQESAAALDRAGHPFGPVPKRLLSTASSLSDQSRLLDTWFSSLAEISRIWQQAEAEILAGSASLQAARRVAVPASAIHSPAVAGAAGPADKQGLPGIHTAAVETEEGVKTTSPDLASSDPSASEIDLGAQVSSLTGEKPYSAPVFTTLDPLRKSAYIAVIASALYKQFPSLALSGSSRVEVPLGTGMSAYSSVSVSGNNSRSDHVKLSQAMDINTGLLKENISISADGSTVSFSKDGVSVSRKTDAGTWKIDPTSLSRTARVKLDDNTTCSFTEKVDARGYSSFDKTVATTIDGVSVSTSAGIKTSDAQKPGSPTPVLSPAVRHAEAQRQRMEAITKLLTAGLVGDLAGAAMPIPVPVPAG